MKEYQLQGNYRTLSVVSEIVEHYNITEYNIFQDGSSALVRKKHPHTEQGDLLFGVNNDKAKSIVTIKADKMDISPEAIEQVRQALEGKKK